MTIAFLDTAGLLALWDVRDQWHDLAEEAYARLLHAGATFASTELVFAECANAASRWPFRLAVADMRLRLLGAGSVLHPTGGELAEAWETYRQAPPGRPGVVDLISFAVMRRYEITDALTNDRHFKAAGFNVLF